MSLSRQLIIATVALAVTGGGAGAAAEAPAANPLLALAQQVESRYKARLLVDPELPVTKGLRLPEAGQSLDRSLDILARRIPGAAWRRVYLPERAAFTPDAARIAAVVRALNTMDLGHLTVDRPEHKDALRFTRIAGPVGAPRLRVSGKHELFILYSRVSTSDGRAPEARLADLQHQQLALESANEHLPLGVGQLMQLMSTLPPAQMERLAAPTVEASFRIWDATPPEQRQFMMRQTMEVLQPLLHPSIKTKGPNSSSRSRPVPTINRLPDLARIARTLEERSDARLVLDPMLYITKKPVLPQEGTLLPIALNAVTEPLAGVGWRKIEVPASLIPRLNTRRAAYALTAAVRAVQSLEQPDIAFHDAETGDTTSFQVRTGDKSFESANGAPPLHPDPVYLIYDESPLALGRTPEERLRNIQQQQFQEMFRMSPDQITRSMEGALRTYDSANPAAQKRVLSLPILSGMMAGWFPRQAKESMR